MNTAHAEPHPDPAKPPSSAPLIPARPGRLRLLAVLPIPVLLLTMLALWAADLRGAYESASLLLVLNFVCSMLAPFCIAWLVARSFLVRPTLGLLLVGCGVIAWGAAGLLGVVAGITAAAGGQLDINLFITTHNLCVWLSAACHLAGAGFSLGPRRELPAAKLWLTAAYTLVLGAVGLVLLSAFAHWTPVFFVQGQGGSLARFFTLGSATAMFVLSAALLGALNRRESSRFVYWYTLALSLIAVGLFGIMIESVHAGPLSWTGRAAQFLGGAYMLVAAVALGRQPSAGGLALAPGPSQVRYRYAVAIAIVVASAAVRLALLQSLGTRAVFITFYPAVMLAALYGGFRSGLLATVLSAAVANYFWMEPVGHFSLKDPADGLSLVIFLLSCLMITWITDAMRRAQERTAQAEAEAKVAAERVRATEARQQKESELREAQHIAHIGSWHWDAKTDVTTGSDELLRIYGFDPASQAMPNFKDQRGRCYPAEDWERVNAAVQRTLETGVGYELDVQAIRNGVPIWVTTRGELARDADGKIAGLRGTVQDITARKRAEESLRERDERFTTLLANLQSGVALVDERGQFVLCNASFLRIFGLSSEIENVNSQDWSRWQVFAEHGELLPVNDHPVRKASLTGKPVRNQLVRVKRPADGEELWLLVSAEPILKPDGRLHQMICTYYDITDRKRAEEALQRSEDRLRLAVEAANLGTWDLDLDTGVAAHSLRHDQIWGYQEPQPKWGLEIAMRNVVPEDRPMITEAYARGMKTGVVSHENRIVWPDGSIHWIGVEGRVTYDREGRAVRVIGVVADITERKRSEQALRQRAEDALRLSEQEFRSLAEAVPQIVWATRPDGWNIYFNQQWVDYTGMTAEESYGHGWNTPFHPDDQQRAWEAWQRATQHNERYSLECRLRRADGVYRWWLIRGEPMRGANGEILKWFGTCTDIEEIKKAQAELQEANDLLEQRVAERTAALQKSQQLLQDVIDGSPSPIFLKDADGKFLTINTSLERMLGMAREELRGKTDYDIAPQAVADYWRAHDKQVMETGKAIQIEEAADLPDGHHIFLANKFPLVDATGQIYGVGAISHDITEQKRVEAALRDSEKRLGAIVSSAMDAIVSVDVDQRIVLFNAAAERMFGYRAQDAVGQPLNMLLPTDRRALHDQHIRAFAATGVTARQMGALGEVAGLRANGEQFPIEVSISQIEVEGHKLLTVILRDITDRKQAEEAMRRSEEQLHALADSMLNLAWWANGDGFITWYNRRWYEYTGTTPEQMEGWGWQSVHDPQMLPEVMKRWQASIATGEPFDMTFPLRGADGRFRSFLTRAQPLKDAQGRVVQWFGTNTDVEELKRTEEALREAEQRLRFALETSHTGAWDLDLVDHTAFRSLEHDRVFGYPELLPEWTYEMFLQHVLSEDRAAVDGKFRKATLTQGVWDFECRIRRADGDVRWIWGAGRHRTDAAGGKRRMAGIVQDITDRKQAEETIKASLREKEVMLKEIHHRVKNNLQVISSLLDLQTDSLQDPAQRAVFTEMRDRVRSMALVHEKLYQSQSLARVEFADYTHSLLSYLARANRTSETTVRLKLDLQPVSLRVGTAVPCGLILNELVTNAFKHAFRGRAQGEIIAALGTGADGRVCLRVSDDGVGLPAGLDWRQSRSLGLRLIHLLAGQLNATVEVRATHGTEFLITFAESQSEPSEQRTHA
jgi:PAS domain S-box-containing protein